MLDVLALPFFQRALLAGLLASVACGIVGTYVVAKRISSISGGLAHAAFGGVGVGYFLGIPPMWGATLFALLSGVGIGVTYRRFRSGMDTTIAMFWAVGMAVGILFVSLTPGYAPDLLSFLFGSILFVTSEYVRWVLILDLLILGVILLAYKELQAVTFDEEFAEIMGVPVEALLHVLLGLVSLTVVVLIRVVGVILVIALLTIPAATARHWTGTLWHMMLLATMIGAACTVAGLWASYWISDSFALGVPTGPLIILAGASAYGASLAARSLRDRLARG